MKALTRTHVRTRPDALTEYALKSSHRSRRPSLSGNHHAGPRTASAGAEDGKLESQGRATAARVTETVNTEFSNRRDSPHTPGDNTVKMTTSLFLLTKVLQYSCQKRCRGTRTSCVLVLLFLRPGGLNTASETKYRPKITIRPAACNPLMSLSPYSFLLPQIPTGTKLRRTCGSCSTL